MADLDAADRRRAGRLMTTPRRSSAFVMPRASSGETWRATSRPSPGSPIANDLAKLLGDGDPADAKLVGRLLEVLTEGRDESLDVRWRLVDDAGRPVGVSGADVTAALKRARPTD